MLKLVVAGFGEPASHRHLHENPMFRSEQQPHGFRGLRVSRRSARRAYSPLP